MVPLPLIYVFEVRLSVPLIGNSVSPFDPPGYILSPLYRLFMLTFDRRKGVPPLVGPAEGAIEVTVGAARLTAVKMTNDPMAKYLILSIDISVTNNRNCYLQSTQKPFLF